MEKRKQTFNVLFWVRKGRGNENMAPLYCRVTISGQRYEIPTNIRVSTQHWSAEAQRAIGRTESDKEANLIIERMTSDIEEDVRKIHQKGFELTMENFRLNYQAKENKYSTLSTIFEYHRLIKSKNLTPSTNWQYGLTLRHLLNFVSIKYRVSDYALEAINKVFVNEFFAYLQGFMRQDNKRICSQNGAIKHVQRLGKVLQLAVDNEWISRNPARGMGEKRDKTDIGYLTEEEIKAFETVELSPGLSLVRYEFLFSVYTGTPYAEMCRLTNDNIKLGIDHTKWLIYVRGKTGERVSLPLLEPAEKIIRIFQDYHGDGRDNKLFPMSTNQVTNRALKEIAKAAHVNQRVTFHMARHTFATTITLIKGIPMETVSRMLGHTKIATTQIYAKVVDRKVMDDMAALKTMYADKTESDKKASNH